ncbi:MAG: sensor domain-containing diguanylate cyclase [Patescibacteria group bacterium]
MDSQNQELEIFALENEKLRGEIKRLKREIERQKFFEKRFMDQVKSINEIILKMSKVDESISQVGTFEDLFVTFFNQMRTVFKIEFIKIALILEEEIVDFIQKTLSPEFLKNRFCLFNESEFLILSRGKVKPVLENKDPRFPSVFFEVEREPILSTALVPFVHGERIVGGLCLGSRDRDRFDPKYEVDLLEKLGRKFSICLGNVLVKEQLLEANKKQKDLSIRDELTGLLNRRGLFEVLRQILSRAKRHNLNITLALIDLDDFKMINDTNGHNVGDKVLVRFSEILEKKARKEDYISRLGGDEFVVVLSGMENGNIKDVDVFFDRISNELENNPFFHDSKRIAIRFSWGALVLSAEQLGGGEPEKLIKMADGQMYNWKKYKKWLFQKGISDNITSRRTFFEETGIKLF